MKLRYKIIFSLFLQIFFFVSIPSLLDRVGLYRANWIQVWEDISHHKIFASPAPQKVVLLGDSEFGERFCHENPESAAATDDDCALRAVLNFKKGAYPHIKNFQFFDFSKNGTIAEAHLYYFLHLMDIPDHSVKYVIYAAPDKLFLKLHERSYFMLNEKTADKIDALPTELKNDKLTKLASEYRARISTYEKEERYFRYRYLYRRAPTLFWSQRLFFHETMRDIRYRLAPNSPEIIFNTYLEKHQKVSGTYSEDQYPYPLASPDPHLFFEKDSDFDFLDIIYDLCQKKGIQLVLYFPPDRVTCPNFQLEPCNTETYIPVIKHFANKNVPLLDFRSSEFKVPRDSLDGVHPSLSFKLTLAEGFLNELEKFETNKQN